MKNKASNAISAKSTFVRFLRYHNEKQDEDWDDLIRELERRLGPSLGEWFGVREFGELERFRSTSTDSMVRVWIFRSERRGLEIEISKNCECQAPSGFVLFPF